MFAALVLGTLLGDVDALARHEMTREPNRLPSLSLAVYRDGEPVLARAYGYADIERRVRATPQTTYATGSTTKLLTAVIAMQLVRAHELNLDTPLVHYLPNAPYGDIVTPRMLLAHRSGYPDLSDERTMTGDPASFIDRSMERLAHLPLEFPPDSQVSYSSSNYTVLGRLIERIVGEPYETYARRELLDPLGLKHSSFADDASPGFARSYEDEGTRFSSVEQKSLHYAYSAGGLRSTPSDIATFESAFLHHRLLSQPEIDTMSADVFGFGIFRTHVDGKPVYWTMGNFDAQSTMTVMYPDRNLVVTASANVSMDRKNLGEFIAAIADRVSAIPPATDVVSADEPKLARALLQHELAGILDRHLFRDALTADANARLSPVVVGFLAVQMRAAGGRVLAMRFDRSEPAGDSIRSWYHVRLPLADATCAISIDEHHTITDLFVSPE